MAESLPESSFPPPHIKTDRATPHLVAVEAARSGPDPVEIDIGKARTLADLRGLFDNSPEAENRAAEDNDGGYSGGWTLTPRQERILEAWREKFIESFSAAKSTAERLLILEEAPHQHFASKGILYDNHLLFGDCTAETIAKAESFHELTFIGNWLTGKWGRDASLQTSSFRSYIEKKLSDRKRELAQARAL